MLEPFDGEARVEFQDMTDKITKEFESYQARTGVLADNLDEFLEKNYYETAEIDGKTVYGYWRNPNTLYEDYCIGGRFKEWLVRKEQYREKTRNKTASKKYYEMEHSASNQVIQAMKSELGYGDSEKDTKLFDLIYAEAYEEGHSSGFDEIYNYLLEFDDLVRSAIAISNS